MKKQIRKFSNTLNGKSPHRKRPVKAVLCLFTSGMKHFTTALFYMLIIHEAFRCSGINSYLGHILHRENNINNKIHTRYLSNVLTMKLLKARCLIG